MELPTGEKSALPASGDIIPGDMKAARRGAKAGNASESSIHVTSRSMLCNREAAHCTQEAKTKTTSD